MNNAAVALSHLGDHTQASAFLRQSADLRAEIDDERGLAVTLNNLGLSLLRCGESGQALTALVRARAVAQRNDLRRLASSVAMNLASAQYRRGKLRDAYHTLSGEARALGSEADDEMRAFAHYWAGVIALDLGYTRLAKRHVGYLAIGERSVGPSSSRHCRLSIEIARREGRLHDAFALAATLASGSREFQAALDLVRAELPEGEELAGSVAKLTQSHARDRDLSDSLRVRALRLSRSVQRAPLGIHSLERMIRLCRARGLTLERVEWIRHFMESRETQPLTNDELARVLKAICSPELEEGHHAARSVTLGLLGSTLLSAGRFREASVTVRSALKVFEQFERRHSRSGGDGAVLEQAFAAIDKCFRSLGEHPEGAQLPMTQKLRSAAFTGLMQYSSALDQVVLDEEGRFLGRIAASLDRAADTDSAISELCRRAVELTGAQRCLIALSDGGRIKLMSIGPGESRLAALGEKAEISWAVVSQVMRTGRRAVSNDALCEDELAGHRSVSEFSLRSLAVFPLTDERQVVGAMYLDHQGVAGLFGEREVATLQGLSALVSLCLRARRQHLEATSGASRLDAAERQVILAHRTAVAGELINGRAHDLKNVLAAVMARCQLIRKRDCSSDVRKSADSIERAAVAGVEILERIQGYTRAHGSESARDVDLIQTVDQCVDLVRPRMRPGDENEIQFRLITDSPSVLVRAGRADLRDLVLNLLVNACDAIEGAGLVTVRVIESQREVEFTVTDSGCGIPDEAKSRIFEPFFTTKKDGGTGLGLAVVGNVVATCGGSIEVQSELGVGTAILVRLPRVDVRAQVQSTNKKRGSD